MSTKKNKKAGNSKAAKKVHVEKEYTYDIILFVEQDNEFSKSKKSIDIVPGIWVKFNKARNCLVTRFLPPPYTEVNLRDFHKMVKNCSQPLEIWPEYAVELRGDVYSEALKRMEFLKTTKEYAYTTDIEKTAETIADELTKKKMKYKRSKTDSDTQEKLLRSAPTLNNQKELLSKDINENQSSLHLSKELNVDDSLNFQDMSISIEHSVSNDSLMSVDERDSLLEKNIHSTLQNDENEDKLGSNNTQKKNDDAFAKKSTVNLNAFAFNPETTEEERDNPILLFERIVKAIHLLYLEQNELKRLIIDLTPVNANQPLQKSLPELLEEKYCLYIPVKTMEEFEKLNQLILLEKPFRKEFKSSVLVLLNKDNVLSRSLRNVLKQFISRDVIINYTAQKQVENKAIFKSTEFCKVLKAVLFAKYNSATNIQIDEQKFYKELGSTISNAVDWDGFRAFRKQKKSVGNT
ncbi:uncharacterized protein LOC127287953 isoform X2 [Leptopilina boulardi]|uniref:uncharacterized protein LOC127278260 isoform X2 n=1 Tax=Leptopilina boulardi TaxID=63433 RepID=UPI0021F5D978|nr:uncharacterized protein LOC127278260 isoform X2 [Leptopilina boulardi]XP_051155836.1 uncharacterized protein LOC127278261 isoform X2 [Leptopilina boulardi]XP_051171081.1 uncharacterized protein LOC127287953 isoform X2 [Leptopilina boulardi]